MDFNYIQVVKTKEYRDNFEDIFAVKSDSEKEKNNAKRPSYGDIDEGDKGRKG